MKNSLARAVLLLCSLTALSGLAACVSLAADVTPPPDYVPPQPVQIQSTAYPLVPPDPENGAAIYVEKCLACHGERGLGDGPQALNLPQPPPAIGTANVVRLATPADWFDVVTYGNLEKFMPGFSGSLTDRQRWDVVTYVFSLSVTEKALETGKEIYTAECVDCHGGRGEGSENGSALNAQQRLAVLSNAELERMVNIGPGDMPSFSNRLNATEVAAVVTYVRSMTLAERPQPASAEAAIPPEPAATQAPVETETAEAEIAAVTGEERLVTIRGRAAYASGNAGQAGLTVTLAGFEAMSQSFEQETVTAADGSFEFTGVLLKPDMAFMAWVVRDGYTYTSEILQAEDVIGQEADLPITLFETTSDPGALYAERLHVFFDFSQPGAVQVVQLYIIDNPTGKAVVAASDDQPALTFQVPAGASNLGFDDALGNRFVKTEDGFGDLQAVQPAPEQHQVLFSYDFPYNRKASLEIPLALDVNAAVIMLPAAGIKLESAQLVEAGSRDVQGVPYRIYSAAGLDKGTSLKIDLSGNSTAGFSQDGGELTGLVIGIGIFAAALAAAGIWLYRQRRQNEPLAEPLEAETGLESEDELLDAILTLDDLHRAGRISEEAYMQRRAELKEKLRQVRSE